MRRTVEAQEDDDKVITQGKEEHGIPKEVGDPVVLRYERHQEELQDVEEDPDRRESSDGDLDRSMSEILRIHTWTSHQPQSTGSRPTSKQ